MLSLVGEGRQAWAGWQGWQGPLCVSCNDLHEPPGCRTELGLGEEREKRAWQGRAVASEPASDQAVNQSRQQFTEAKRQSMINTMDYARTCRPCPIPQPGISVVVKRAGRCPALWEGGLEARTEACSSCRSVVVIVLVLVLVLVGPSCQKQQFGRVQ